MINYQVIDCLGASLLDGGLLEAIGIKYLHASVPGHSTTILLTSDGKIYLQDFTPGI